MLTSAQRNQTRHTHDRTHHLRILTVSSGKGGVGKTNLVANVAIALAQAGQRVLVLDADLGLANLDILLGLAPTLTLDHVLKGEHPIEDVVLPGPGGVQILPAASGIQSLTALTSTQQDLLQEELDRLTQHLDVLLIDTGAGISSNVIFFATAAHDILVVVTPEPTSITDAYALIKVVTQRDRLARIHLIVNQVKTAKEGPHVFHKLQLVADRFLDIQLDYLGMIPVDEQVSRSVCRQQPIRLLFPQSPASQAYGEIATRLLNKQAASAMHAEPSFWRQWLTRTKTEEKRSSA